MALRSRIPPSVAFLAAFVVVVVEVGALDSGIPSQTLAPSFPKAISDLKEAVVRGLGKQAEGFEITGFDAEDALVGQSVAYEFHVQVDNKVFPVKLLEDVTRWDFVDIPMFREGNGGGKELAEVGKVQRAKGYPVLAPFELAGPMELWIQDGDDMRLSLPHDVDAGVLKKVILSDGAVVTVKGARSVSLRHPVELPLPLNRSNYKGRPVASGLLTLAEALRHASRSNEKPLLSLRIVGPTSLTSSSATSSKDRLKLKRLAPGLVELSSPSVPAIASPVEELDMPTMWPFTSFNGSDMNLRGFEELLASVLGEKGREEGSFQLLRADVSTRTYVKLNFAMARRLSDTDLTGFPGWKTRPEKLTSHYEVLARVEDNGKIVPERIAEVQPYEAQETVLGSVLTGNVTMSSVPVVHPPPVYFTL